MITGTFGRSARTFGSISRPLMPGMLMSDRIRIRDGLDTLQCSRSRQREFHDEAARTKITPGMLAEHAFNIGLVIDNENVGAQVVPPAASREIIVRGRVIMNSVKTHGSVSTSIVPPCCFTTMSWLIERPSPVPSPAGLVVKKGTNISSFTSGA